VHGGKNSGSESQRKYKMAMAALLFASCLARGCGCPGPHRGARLTRLGPRVPLFPRCGIRAKLNETCWEDWIETGDAVGFSVPKGLTTCYSFVNENEDWCDDGMPHTSDFQVPAYPVCIHVPTDCGSVDPECDDGDPCIVGGFNEDRGACCYTPVSCGAELHGARCDRDAGGCVCLARRELRETSVTRESARCGEPPALLSHLCWALSLYGAVCAIERLLTHFPRFSRER
jgi:hypothetical protein